jgi:hypothetical protein
MRDNNEQIESTDDRARPGRSSRHRSIALGTAGAAALVAALLLFSPLASAASSGSSTTLTAPYTGTASLGVVWTNAGCDSSATVTHLPAFNSSSGSFTGGLSSATGACGKAESTSFAEGTLSFSTTSFSTTSNGSFALGASWTFAFSVDLTHYARSSGSAGSYVVVGAWAVLNDLTSGGTWNVGNSSWSFGSSTHGTWVAHTGSANYNGTFALVAGHQYVLVTGLYVQVNSWSSWNGHARSSAAVNMATGSNKAVLTALVIA